jgi:outer membrane protein
MFRIFLASFWIGNALLAQQAQFFALPDNTQAPTLTLEEAFQKALAKNERLLQRNEDIGVQKGVTVQNLGRLLPTITGTGILSEQLSLGLSLKAPLFDLSNIFGTRSASTLVRSVERSYERARDTLLFDVALAYYQAWLEQELLAVARNQQHISEEQYASAKRKAAVEEVSRLDLKRAELLVAKTKSKIISADTSWRLALGRLAYLLGENTLVKLAEPQNLAVLDSQNSDNLRQQAKSKRKDLEAQSIAVQAAWYAKQSALWLMAPTLSAGFDLKYPWGGDHKLTGNLTLAMPFFDGGIRYGLLGTANSKWRQEKLKKALLEREIDLEIGGSLTDIDRQKDLLTINKQLLEIAEVSVKSAENRRAVGQASSLDVLDEQTRLFDAQSELRRSEVALSISRIRLAYVLGDPRG